MMPLGSATEGRMIELDNVGGFVCQEQEANYVDMLLLRRGCTFIARSLQRQ